MADSIAPIVISNTKIEIFATTGIAVGTSITVQNIGGTKVVFAEKATSPTGEIGGALGLGEQYIFKAGSNGIWVYTDIIGAKSTICVQVV